MADYSRIGTSVSSYEDILDELVSFLTATGPGAAWVEDASYPNSGHAGELFIATSGATTGYVYLKEETVDSNDVLQAYWVPSSANGYGGSSGPTNHKGAEGCGFFLDFTVYDYYLDVFSDEERCVAVVRGTKKVGDTPALVGSNDTHYQILYLGEYTPGDSTNDTYPMAVLGHYTYLLQANVAPDGYEADFFPEAMCRALSAAGTGVGQHRQGSSPFSVLHGPGFDPPKNSYGSEALAFPQQVFVNFPGSEYAFTLTGMYVTTKDVGLEQDVSIGGADYRSYPTHANVYPLTDGGQAACYLIPKGTDVP
jgi:hypothetical protein